MDLDRLAVECGSDKYSDVHKYTPTYARIWQHLRGEPITLLEIGVLGGASLRMWEQYFPNAKIHGIDIDPACNYCDRVRSTVWIGDQCDAGFLDMVAESIGPIDIVIDDGGHRTPDQLISLNVLWPHVRPGGWYAIEDLGACYSKRFGGALRKFNTIVGRTKRLLDEMNAGCARPEYLYDPSVDQPFPRSVMADELAAIHYYGQLVVFEKKQEIEANGKDRP